MIISTPPPPPPPQPNPGEWSTPEVSGDQPPPCVDFSFLSIDNHRAVVFGGFQPDKGAVSETYVLDMASWVSDTCSLNVHVDFRILYYPCSNHHTHSAYSLF